MPKMVYVVTYSLPYSLPGCVPDDPESNVCFSSRKKAYAYIDEQIQEGKDLQEDQDWNDPYEYDIIPISRAEAKAQGYEIL